MSSQSSQLAFVYFSHLLYLCTHPSIAELGLFTSLPSLEVALFSHVNSEHSFISHRTKFCPQPIMKSNPESVMNKVSPVYPGNR
ncbi:uncharacterized protein BO72DRAFT_46048 [Aspergillus fijiensis CBS 313.89]|uniref:Uncharacterized protein n=1 Tax=Aspergillus fijiensis CBS 313.89 TaxID=1448319 RepID=A0A8G1W1A9_9EURO|nr:uncharacterized protein BO72DRAFT_46048 [Aspergillus fijiensis CBS 313.89]RAK79488.1 hypothetical protein BO72DRAFT_46048 [Aspergillus fijiensis CBS 313.89]